MKRRKQALDRFLQIQKRKVRMNQPITNIFASYGKLLFMFPVVTVLFRPTVQIINMLQRFDGFYLNTIIIGFIAEFSTTIYQFPNNKG